MDMALRTVTKRITHLREKLLLAAAYLVVLAVRTVCNWPCVYRMLFHIYCPGCGMTRAYISLFHLHIRQAFASNFMFWSIPICGLYVLFDGRLFRSRWLDGMVLSGIGAGFLFLFVARLFGYLCI